jgi:putative drug exporter of the RND superfamily
MGQVELKMLGVGLAAAILLDATVVRAVLLPAAMTVLATAAGTCPAAPPQPSTHQKTGAPPGRSESRRE